jgi:hypothetical protein
MNRFLVASLAVLLIAAPAASALAQDVLAKKVTIDVNAATPVSVFTAVATASGAGFTVTVDPAVTDPVDIAVRNVSVKTALNAVCESIGCQWTLTGKTLVVKPEAAVRVGVVMRGEGGATVDKTKAKARAQVVLAAFKQKLPSDMNFENAPLDAVNTRLSEALKMKVELSSKAPGVKTISLDFGGLTLLSALQALGQQEGAKGPWRLTIGPAQGDTQTPTIAIMVDPRPQKKR